MEDQVTDPDLEYERIRDRVHQLDRSSNSRARTIEWLVANRLGVAKDHAGHLEIYINSEQLVAITPIVDANIDYQTWYDQVDGSQFQANRLFLPTGSHLEQAAAFICVELIAAGVRENAAGAFAKTERLIDVWLQQLQLSNEVILGLVGELLVLHSLALSVDSDHIPDLVNTWHGFRRSDRDFQIGPIGIEVKTTTGQKSSHNFSNLRQLQVGFPVGGGDESRLYVASIGLNWDDGANPDNTLPTLVEGICKLLRETSPQRGHRLADSFIENVERYGSEPSVGYHHPTMSDSPRYSRPFAITFSRVYDMADDGIEILRVDDLLNFPHVAAESVSYRATFPDTVRGDLNPIKSLAKASEHVLNLVGWRE